MKEPIGLSEHPIIGTSVFRFAPSPNGRLHLGHAYSALLNTDFAQKTGGRFIVRIEDIDTPRCTPELTQACLDDLAWLGLQWEQPVRIQSQHFSDYILALNKLKEKHLVYPCFCSRGDIAKATTHYSAADRPRDPDNTTLYPGTCRHIKPEEAQARILKGTPHAWRLDVEEALKQLPAPLTYTRFDEGFAEETVAADPARWGDVILQRKDTPTSYHIAVVVDDALQNITHVVRGKDLEAATNVHVLLQKLLGLPTPLYHHHELLRDDAGGKLAKSKGSETLADLRARGVSAGEVKVLIVL